MRLPDLPRRAAARSSLVLLATGALLGGGCSAPSVTADAPGAPTMGGTGVAASPRTDDLALLVAWMSGSFTSAAQAERDPDYRTILLHMAPIWPERDDGRWLYVEQAVAETPDAPYRQRIYRVTRDDAGVFTSAVYELPVDPRTVIGAWRDPDRLADIDPATLIPRTGCEVILTLVGDAFVGTTRERACASTLRGAAWASSEVRITAEGIDSWDRGWTDDGRQAWGAEKGAYEFRRE